MSVARSRKADPKPSPDEPELSESPAESGEHPATLAEHASEDQNRQTRQEVSSDQLAAEIASTAPEYPVDARDREAEGPIVKIERRGGFLPLLFGGLAAGGIGFGVAAYLLPNYFSGQGDIDVVDTLRRDVTVQADRLTALDGAVAGLRSAQDTLVVAPEVTDALSAQIADIGTRLDAMDQSVAALGERFATLDARLTNAEQRPVSGDAASAAALETFQREMEGLRAEVAAQQQSVEVAKDGISAAAKAAAEEIDAVRADAERLRGDAEAAAHNAAIASGISLIEAALDSGAALSEPISQLVAAGVDVPAALKDQAQGVPTLGALRESFPDAARIALAVSVREEAGPDIWSRITAFFRSQSGARSLTPRAGGDPDAVLSRAEADLRAADLPNAVAELESLPEAGQAAMSEWVTRAERRVQALEAVVTLKRLVE
jgi:hypothetical protein